MCLYWKKVYLCSCISHVFRDRCPPCLRSGTNDKCGTMEMEAAPRKSYFKCYDCLIKEDKEEKEADILKAQEAETQRAKEAEKTRQEKIRREAQERAQRELEEDLRRKRDLKAEQERAKRDGGVWTETVNTKRGKGRKGTSSLLPTPFTAKPAISFKTGAGTYGVLNFSEPNKDTTEIMTTETKGEENKDRKDDSATERRGKTVDPGGRAGRWGPSISPKTILKPERPAWNKI